MVKSIEQLTAEFEQQQAELNKRVQAKQSEIDVLTQETDNLNGEVEQAKATLEQLQAEIEQAKRVQSSSFAQARAKKVQQDALAIEQRRARLVDILTDEGDIGATAFAHRLNISRGTVYGDLKALNNAGLIVKNGQGWEVTQ